MQKSEARGRRDGSEDKSTGCSSQGAEFKSQHPDGGPESPIMESDALFCHPCMQANRVFISIKYSEQWSYHNTQTPAQNGPQT